MKYRTFDEVVEERFREHPEELDGFLQTVMEEYEKNPDEGALLSALRPKWLKAQRPRKTKMTFLFLEA